MVDSEFEGSENTSGWGKKGGQGEIYLHPDPIDLEIADFRFEFERWVKNNTSSSDPQINNNSTGEVAP